MTVERGAEEAGVHHLYALEPQPWLRMQVLCRCICTQVAPVPPMQEMQVQSLGGEDPLEEGTATHSSILAWEAHGQRSLVGYSPSGSKELNVSEYAHTHTKAGTRVHTHACAQNASERTARRTFSARGLTRGRGSQGSRRKRGSGASGVQPWSRRVSVAADAQRGCPLAAARGAEEGRACVRAAQGGEGRRGLSAGEGSLILRQWVAVSW